MRDRLARVLLALLLWSAGSWAVAAGPERPKIGLALAGGGAKGAAHVGVLEVLEELRVPVDYLAGTSMGSIIGGLYASGLSTAELRELLLTADWDDLLRDKPRRRELSFRRKEEDARYLIDLELGLRGGKVAVPSGLITGQKLFFLLQSLTLGVSDVQDFDRLPIPFRAVATDVNSGEMVVLDRGDLATAMRASMAIPSAFSPVEREGRLLVDGGLVNNVPVDVVRQMGADLVIAVDLGAPLSSREVGSFLQIYQQTTRMLTRGNMEPRLADADLVLQPAVSGYGTLQFDAVAEILQAGVAEARARAADLERFRIGPGEQLSAQAARPPRPAPVVAAVRIEGNQRVDERVIAEKIRLPVGEPLDLSVLSGDLSRVYGLGDFETVDFRLAESDGGAEVVVRAREKPWGPNYLRFGLSVQSDLDGETALGLVGNLTATRLNRRGGEWRNELGIGGGFSVTSELYQPLDFRGRWFVAPSLEHRRSRPELYEEGREVAELSVRRATLAIDLGFQFSKFAEVRLGIERGRADVNIDSGRPPFPIPPEVDLDQIDFGAVVLELRSDRLDNATFPRHGSRSRLRAFVSREELGADRQYNRMEAAGGQFWSFGPHTLFGALEAGWSPGGDLPVYDELTLGGFLSLSGFAEDELRGQALGLVRLGLFRQLFGRLYLGGWLEGGNVWQDSDQAGFDDLIFASTLFAGLDTLLGPVYLGVGVAEEGQNKVYVSIGRGL